MTVGVAIDCDRGRTEGGEAMAKARKKKARKSAKRAPKKRKTAVRSKARKAARARRARSRAQGSLADAVREAAALRRRLTGPNTFED